MTVQDKEMAPVSKKSVVQQCLSLLPGGSVEVVTSSRSQVLARVKKAAPIHSVYTTRVDADGICRIYRLR